MESKMVTLRKATEDDLAHVSKLSELWVSENIIYGLVPDSVPYLRNYIGEYFWVAEADSEIAGYTFGTVRESDGLAVIGKGETYLEIESVYVRPEYRNRNIGHQLVGKLIRTAEQNGISRALVLSASKQWQKIVGFYEKHGFKMWYVQMYR